MTADATRGPASDDSMRDAHLGAALRHAPDRDLAPPPALSLAIVNAARAATRREPRTTTPGRGWRWLADLTLQRPAWGGAVAAMAVASITMMLWSGQDVPAPIVAPPLAAPTIAAAADSSSAQAPSATPAPTVPAAVAEPTLAAGSSLSSPSAASRSKGRAAASPRGALSAQVDSARRNRQASTQVQRTDNRAAAGSDLPSPAETAAAAEQPQPAAEPDALMPARIAAAKAARAEGAAGPSARAQQSESSLADAALAPANPAGMGVRALPSPSVSPLQTLIAGSAAGGSVWRWQRANSANAMPLDGDAHAFLQRLDKATHGRWVRTLASAPGAVAATATLPAWRWWRGDRLAASLQVDAAGLRFTDSDGQTWFAALSAAEIDALR